MAASSVMFGGVNINPQFKALKSRVDILVADAMASARLPWSEDGGFGNRKLKGLFGVTGKYQRSSRRVNRRTPASAMQEITLREGPDRPISPGSGQALVDNGSRLVIIHVTDDLSDSNLAHPKKQTTGCLVRLPVRQGVGNVPGVVSRPRNGEF